ncbi:hypothetical protein O6H91_Y319000 [Diphasiastrum complanatum]|nr:hypothetical protein O6H91_Y319000 [Diphasiastrum complanatum]
MSGSVIRSCWPTILGFSLITIFLFAWNISLAPKTPVAVLQSITIPHWKMEMGEDRVGVPTALLSCRVDVDLNYINPDHLWGLDVDGRISMRIFLRPITATMIPKFHQPRRSFRKISTHLVAYRTPLYGASPSVASKDGDMFYIIFEASITSTSRYLKLLYRFHRTDHIFCQFTGVSVGSNYTLAVIERSFCPQLQTSEKEQVSIG